MRRLRLEFQNKMALREKEHAEAIRRLRAEFESSLERTLQNPDSELREEAAALRNELRRTKDELVRVKAQLEIERARRGAVAHVESPARAPPAGDLHTPMLQKLAAEREAIDALRARLDQL